jgi:hypothetical protein
MDQIVEKEEDDEKKKKKNEDKVRSWIWSHIFYYQC